MDNYNLPMKIEANDDEEYIVEHNENGEYDEDELVSPNGQSESDWGNLQDSAAGKLRLKRRRKCGQCGPCQVKENCDKCHFCLRRDVLKQSCIYRKCLYLRKKPSRVRDCVPSNSRHPSSSQSPSTATATASVSACGSGPAQNNSTSPLSPPQPSPSFMPSNSATSNHHHLPTPDTHRPLLPVDPLSGFQPDSLRQLPVPPPPDPLRSYQSPPQSDVLRSHSADQVRSPHSDMRPMSSDTVRSLPTSQAPPTSVEQLRSMTTDPLHHMQSESLRHFQNNHLRPFQADQPRPHLGMEMLRPFPSEQYGMAAYGPPRHVWPPPGLPSPYNFQANNMNMAASPSCRMSLPEACRYSMPAQPSFPHHPHHHMPFNINSDFRHPVPFGTPSSLGPPMNPPFYPPPPVPPVPSTSLPTLPIVQYSASQEAYPGSRFTAPPMYTGSLYSPFRPPSEPYIYHALFPPAESVFSGNGSKMASFRDQFLRTCDKFDLCSKDFNLTGIPEDDKTMMLEKYKNHISDPIISDEPQKLSDKMRELSDKYSSSREIDEDLRDEISRVTGNGECNVCITIDDYKMQAYIRSDGVNNLEIETESPQPIANSSNNNQNVSENHSSNEYSNTDDNENNNNSDITDKENQKKQTETVVPVPKRTAVVGSVCLRQDLGEEGILQLEVPGHRVFLENVVIDNSILSQSEKPDELLDFIKGPNKESVFLPYLFP